LKVGEQLVDCNCNCCTMPKRKLEEDVAEQAVEGLVARVTKGVLEALARQGVGKQSAPKSKRPAIRCWRCCKMGHVARDCKGEVTCYRYGGRGHIQMCATPAPEQSDDLREKLDEMRSKGGEGGADKGAGESGRRRTVTTSSSSSSSSSSMSQSPAVEPADTVRAPLAKGEDLDDAPLQ
jgi:hypothetical protein